MFMFPSSWGFAGIIDDHRGGTSVTHEAPKKPRDEGVCAFDPDLAANTTSQ
jgi:hypothetical protein